MRLTETSSILAHFSTNVNTFLRDFSRFKQISIIMPFLETVAEELDKTVLGTFGGGFVDDVEAFLGAGESDIEKAFLVVQNYVLSFAEETIEISIGVNTGNDALVGFEQNHHV